MERGKLKLLDLFCGAGGAAMGYYRAGFEVVGVDIKPQPHFPFEFHQADALTYPLEGFDVYHASPPCQAMSVTQNFWNARHDHPLLILPTRERLSTTGKPFVIENVSNAKPYLLMDQTIKLIGKMFGLKTIRMRYFECHGFYCLTPQGGITLPGVYSWVQGHGAQCIAAQQPQRWPEAMGIDWMTKEELTQAIPPAYTEYIGKYLIRILKKQEL